MQTTFQTGSEIRLNRVADRVCQGSVWPHDGSQSGSQDGGEADGHACAGHGWALGLAAVLALLDGAGQERFNAGLGHV